MVHFIPDSDGIVHLNRDSGRCGVLINNYDLDNNLTVEITGEPTITMIPMSKIRIPDSVEIKITGGSSTRNYAVFAYSAGDEA